jgi:hypothetical protein
MTTCRSSGGSVSKRALALGLVGGTVRVLIGQDEPCVPGSLDSELLGDNQHGRDHR